MTTKKETSLTTEYAIAVEPVLAHVYSSGKLKNECLFCRSRFCYERVVTYDMSYDEIACSKHIKDLHKHSDTVLPKVVKSFISSTCILKRGVPFK
jgi:hypothetical protein